MGVTTFVRLRTFVDRLRVFELRRLLQEALPDEALCGSSPDAGPPLEPVALAASGAIQ